jgi:hypothetical protein
MTNINPPAFPGVDNLGDPYTGMTLRDYFAAKAMQGITSTLTGTMPVLYDAIAYDSYKIADAMMKARNENN